MLRTVVVSFCLLLAFLAVDNVALVFLVRETLGGSAIAYGLVEAVFGVGMLAGSFLLLGGGGMTAARLLLAELRPQHGGDAGLRRSRRASPSSP